MNMVDMAVRSYFGNLVYFIVYNDNALVWIFTLTDVIKLRFNSAIPHTTFVLVFMNSCNTKCVTCK